MTSIRDDNPMTLADAEAQPSPSLQRARHVPDWEVPVDPPKRAYFSRARIARSWRRSRFVEAVKSRTKPPPPRSVISPTSVDSFPKEATPSASTGSVLPTHRSSFHSFPSPPATLNGGSFPARCRAHLDALLPPDKKQTRLVLLVILVFLAIVALALGLGLGLGLRHQQTLDLPLPDGGARIHEGDLTFFKPALGACGWNSTDADAICAVGHAVFDAAGTNADAGGNPNQNPLCGMMIRVTREFAEDLGRRNGNVSIDVMVVDRCTGCEATDLDLAPGVFNRLAPESRGRVVGRWEWL